MSKSPSPTSVVSLRFPNITIAAQWPLPYAPLTTIFTPPSQCDDKWTLISDGADPKTTSIGQFINLLDTNDVSCLPPGYGSDVWSATFSPGVYCPSGYAIAATGAEVYTAVWEKDIKAPADERRVVCCLSGFGYTKRGDRDACVSSYDESTTALTREYLTESNLFVYTKVIDVGPGIAIGHPIHLRHNDQEFKSLFTGIPTDAAGSGSSDSGGLSTGAIAGIAAGCGVVGLAVLGLGVWFILRHRRRRQEQQGDQKKSSSEEGSVGMTYPDSQAPPAMTGWGAKETTAVTGGHDHGHGGAEEGWTTKEPVVTESSKRKSSRSKRDRGERGERGERERGERSERSRHSRRHES